MTLMGRIAGLKGMRHIALKVSDLAQSKSFYQDIFGMDVVWEPDPQNVYLSSGCDNIALHEVSQSFATGAPEQQLDHLGFVVETIERVKELEQEFQAKGVTFAQTLRKEPWGARTFIVKDLDGNLLLFAGPGE